MLAPAVFPVVETCFKSWFESEGFSLGCSDAARFVVVDGMLLLVVVMVVMVVALVGGEVIGEDGSL